MSSSPISNSLTEDLISWKGAKWPSRIYMHLHKHAPRFKGRDRLSLFLSSFVFKRRIVATNERGIRMTINPTDYIGFALCSKSSFEPLSLTLCARLLEKGGVFFDVGANFGLYSMTMAGIPGVSCVAVDPLPHAVVKLLEHQEMNPGIEMKVFAMALSNESGLLELAMPHKGNFGTGKLFNKEKETSIDLTVRVHSTTFEQLLKASGYQRVNVMKMDVEGHELEALRGIDFSAESAPIHIILEQEPAFFEDSQLNDIWSLLQSHGYRPYDVLGAPLEPDVRPVENNVWWTRKRGDAAFQ